MIPRHHLEPIDIIDWTKIQITTQSLRRNCPGMRLGESLSLIEKWCRDYNSEFCYLRKLATFHFENEKDAMVFSIRWL